MPPILIDLGNVDNTLTVGDDDYRVIGGNGNNTLTFGGGDDDLRLGNGNNTLTLGGGTNRIEAGSGNNTVNISGTGSSRLSFLSGNNTVTVDDGPFRIAAGNGLNTITGGDGNGLIDLGDGTNHVTTANGNSKITIGDGAGNTITTGTGRNHIALGDGTANIVHLGAGYNLVSVAADVVGTDTILGGLESGDGSGNKLLLTSSGTVGVTNISGFATYELGDGGQNRLTLTETSFSRLPGARITVIGGDSGNQVDASVLSVAHAVTIIAGLGADNLAGGAASDLLSYAGSLGAVRVDLAANTAAGGDAAGDTISGFENLTGGRGADRLTGDAGANILLGGDGADTLAGGAGNDLLNGGDGIDRMIGGDGMDSYYVDNAGDVIVEVAADRGSDLLRASVNYTLTAGAAVERFMLIGDALTGTGNAFSQRITGNALDNLLRGMDGDDVLIGGAGRDRLIGGAGADQFLFATPNETSDRITDFTAGEDVLVMLGLGFGGLPLGSLDGDAVGATTRFLRNATGLATAPAGEWQFVQNSTNGLLFFDSNGSDGGGRTVIASLGAAIALTAADIVIA